MSPFRKAAIGAALVASTLTGGAIGAALFAGSASNAATTSTTTPSSSSGSSSNGSSTSGAPAYGGATGRFHSNEDPAHEAGESAQREAQENAGQFPTVP
jgi:hypothetical protein